MATAGTELTFSIQECSKCTYKLRCEECVYNKKGIKQIIAETRNETADKFVERLKAKLTDIIPFEDYEVSDWNYDGMDIENSIYEIAKEIKEGL